MNVIFRGLVLTSIVRNPIHMSLNWRRMGKDREACFVPDAICETSDFDSDGACNKAAPEHYLALYQYNGSLIQRLT